MIELHNIDCMEAMKEMPDMAFDLAIVDPPYGIGWTETINYKSYKQIEFQKSKDYKIHPVKQWDSQKPSKEYFSELFRVSKHQIIWGGNYFTDMLPVERGWIVWNKMGENFTAVNNELAWTSLKKRIKIFSRCHGNDKGFLAGPFGHIHPTQKPVKLYEWILSNYAKQGDKILDTHLGSGSIAIACYNAGYRLTGYEIDKDYYDAAIKRFEQHKRQGRIFDAVSADDSNR